MCNLQELQYENATLKAKLAESATCKTVSMDMLEKKLGGKEYEHRQMKMAMDKELQSIAMELKLATEKVLNTVASCCGQSLTWFC